MKKINVISLSLILVMGSFLVTPFVENASAATANDSISITASVGESISLALNQETLSFGTLVSSGPRYANAATGSDSDVVAHTITAVTSAPSGYTINVAGTTLATSTFTISPILSAAASIPGTEQFGINVSDDGGAGTTNAEFATNFSFATTTPIAAATSASSDVYSVHYLANISVTTETGSYTTALTYTLTSNF